MHQFNTAGLCPTGNGVVFKCRQESGVDQALQYGLRVFPPRLRKNGQQIVDVTNGSCPFCRNEVAEDLANEGQMFLSNSCQRGVGMPGQCPAHPTDIFVGCSSQEFPCTIPFLPQARQRKSEHWQRPALAFDLGDHLFWHVGVDEGETEVLCGFDDGPSERTCVWLVQHSHVRKNRAQSGVSVTPAQEVVSQGNEYVNVGLVRQPAKELSEAALRLFRIQCEQLLELINDEEHLVVAVPPPAHNRNHLTELSQFDQFRDRIFVALEFRHKRSCQRANGASPGWQTTALQPFGLVAITPA